MKRLMYNRKLLDKLAKYLERNPNFRFIQILWTLGFIDQDCDNKIIDRFYEEPSVTWSRIDKGSIIDEEKSSTPCIDTHVNELFICSCYSVEHQLIFSYFGDEDDNKEVYASVHLVPRGLWFRIKNAIKYIFRYRSQFGDFDEFVFNRSDADKLQKVVDYLKF